MSVAIKDRNESNQLFDEIRGLKNDLLGNMNDMRKDLKRTGEVTNDVMRANKELGEKVTSLQSQLIDKGNRVEEMQQQYAALNTKHQDLAQQHVDLKEVVAQLEIAAKTRADNDAHFKSLGHHFCESSEFKHWQLHRDSEKQTRIHKINDRFWAFRAAQYLSLKSTTLDGDNAGAIVDPFYRQDLIEFAKIPAPFMRMLMTVINVTSDQVITKREKAEYALVTTVTQTASAGATEIVVESVRNYSDQPGFNTITLTQKATGAKEKRTIATGGINTSTNTITVTQATTAELVAGDYVSADNPLLTVESGLIPQGLDIWENYTIPIRKLASFIKETEEIFNDAPRLADVIDRRLSARMARAEDKHILYGTGAINGQIPGLFNDTTIPTYVQATASPTGDILLDFIVDLFYELDYVNHMGEAAILNPRQHKKIVKAKGLDGHYIFWPSREQGAPGMAFGAPLLKTNTLENGDATVGAFSRATLYDRREVEILAGLMGDDFGRDEFTVKARQRFGVGFEEPLAILKAKLVTT